MKIPDTRCGLNTGFRHIQGSSGTLPPSHHLCFSFLPSLSIFHPIAYHLRFGVLILNATHPKLNCLAYSFEKKHSRKLHRVSLVSVWISWRKWHHGWIDTIVSKSRLCTTVSAPETHRISSSLLPVLSPHSLLGRCYLGFIERSFLRHSFFNPAYLITVFCIHYLCTMQFFFF